MQSRPSTNPSVELLRSIVQVGKALWRKRAAVNELADIDAPEVGRIARDLGISSADLRLLASRDKTAAALLYRRMETLRVDPTGLDPAVMRDLQRCCSNCDSKQLCAHELEDKPKGATWPSYCPNEQTIVALTRESSSHP
jgi:Family of unknown function (DUF6455)